MTHPKQNGKITLQCPTGATVDCHLRFELYSAEADRILRGMLTLLLISDAPNHNHKREFNMKRRCFAKALFISYGGHSFRETTSNFRSQPRLETSKDRTKLTQRSGRLRRIRFKLSLKPTLKLLQASIIFFRRFT